MSQDLTNFRAWYPQVLEELYPKRDAGIAIFMISLPLLERYLRQKNRLLAKQDVDDRCMATLRIIFPALRDNLTAWNFWRVYRHGFLHQATLSLRRPRGDALPAGSLTHDCPEAVAIESDGSFVVNPVLFSKKVVTAIETDFQTFADVGTTAPGLPQVVSSVRASTGIAPPQTILSTKGR